MEQRELADFRVRILSTEHSTWQGTVEAKGETFAFRSEMQLIRWLCQMYPGLFPEIGF